MTDKKTYATNVVTAKLYGLVGSPTEMVLGTAMFERFSDFYDLWWCHIYSAAELKALSGTRIQNGGSIIGIVPQFPIENIGRVDFAVFLPALGVTRPTIIVECDGHEFHERTPEQASKDRKRDRGMTALGIPTLRFTGADILRDSAGAVAEIADAFNREVAKAIEQWFWEVGKELNEKATGGFFVPFEGPPTRREPR